MDAQSLLSDATTKNQSGEISDSNSSSHQFHIDPNSAASSSKYKGVVSQPNGHWGAQIYANHQRIWLGTFKSEKEAAMAYDSAAIRLRHEHSPRNFPCSNVTARELNFQSQFSTEAVLSMIKDGSYSVRFSDFLKAPDQQGYHLSSLHSSLPGVQLKQLFQKELTPSDVGKLNRLVIPKRYAVKYFPGVSDVKKHNKNSYDLELVFFDRVMRSWKFRYCYWKSSQSFVFTRGWNGFAKEKGLRPRDRVIFSSYEYGKQKLCMINVAYHDGAAPNGRANIDCQGHESASDSHGNVKCEGVDMEKEVDEDARGEVEPNPNTLIPKEGFKLFGVQII